MNKFFKKLLIFLAVLGPSTITTMAGNDGAGVTTYSLAGANFGYAILLTLPFLLILTTVTQEMGSRIAIVTGKGLGDLIREKYGIKIALLIFSCLFIANFGSILANMAALKAASQILGIPTLPFLITVVTFAFILVTRADYKTTQKIFLFGLVLYLSYVISAIMGKPNWADAFKGLVIPTKSVFTREYIITAMAVLGTTITPWGQFFVQSYMKDKKISTDQIQYGRLEAFVGSALANSFTFFMIVATASTLFVHKIALTSGEQAAEAIRPFAGDFSAILFSIGLINASIIGMVVISLTISYAFTEFFGFEGTLDAPFEKSKTFYKLFLINLIIAGILVMTPAISLFKIVIYTQSLNAILLPILFYFLIKITNNKELMGKFHNGRFSNYFAVGASILIIVAAVVAIVASLINRF
ncbi:MAG TPA: divalent metal cation transporter [Candidatus Nitrosocosmicus sp.]|nr:divalent metal cation transporter [Candidatus Nitrosocosmicus sp.]